MILKETLRDIVRIQREELDLQDTGLERDLLSRIDRRSPQVVVLSGIRRCGKSTLLRQLMKTTASFYYFNFEDPRAVSFEVSDFDKLEAVFREEFGESGVYFFDEIQNVPQWERFVRRLQDRGQKVYLTGSNASLLSREFGTRLTGRHLMYELYPFSYPETLRFRKQEASPETLLQYCQNGGFPEFVKYPNPDILRQLFRDIITRDIITRYNVREHRVLMELAVFLLSNCGNPFSFNRLKNQFHFGSINTTIAYVSYLEEAYLLFTVPKFDFSYSRQRTHARKVYAIDPGLIRANTASLSPDYGRILENVVFLHLKRQYPDIYYLKNNFECDFLIKEGTAITRVYQVCYRLTEENLSRELTGLKQAMDLTGATEGAILTLDQEDKVEGIPIIPIWRWCRQPD